MPYIKDFQREMDDMESPEQKTETESSESTGYATDTESTEDTEFVSDETRVSKIRIIAPAKKIAAGKKVHLTAQVKPQNAAIAR